METPETQTGTLPELPRLEACDWYFTFGHGQRLFAGHRAGRGTNLGEGIPVDGCYVKIHADFHTARQVMYRLFGNVWSFQYDALPPGYRYTDLTVLLDLFAEKTAELTGEK